MGVWVHRAVAVGLWLGLRLSGGETGLTFMHVLLIEHDTEFADTLSRAFRLRGVSSTCFSDPDGALRDASAQPPDLILLSADLPTANGFVVCKRIKKDTSLQNIPLVLMSSDPNADKVFEQHARLRTHADVYLKKPLDYETLHHHLAGIVAFPEVAERDDPTLRHVSRVSQAPRGARLSGAPDPSKRTKERGLAMSSRTTQGQDELALEAATRDSKMEEELDDVLEVIGMDAFQEDASSSPGFVFEDDSALSERASNGYQSVLLDDEDDSVPGFTMDSDGVELQFESMEEMQETRGFVMPVDSLSPGPEDFLSLAPERSDPPEQQQVASARGEAKSRVQTASARRSVLPRVVATDEGARPSDATLHEEASSAPSQRSVSSAPSQRPVALHSSSAAPVRPRRTSFPAPVLSSSADQPDGGELRVSHQAFAKVQGEAYQLRETLVSMQHKLDRAERATKRLQDLEKELQALRSQARRSVSPSTGDLALREQVNTKEKEIFQLQERMRDHHREVIELRDRNIALERNIASLEERHREEEDTRKATQQLLERSQQRVASLEQTQAETERDLKGLRSEYESVKAQAQVLRTELAEREALLEETTDRKRQLEESLRETQEKLEHASSLKDRFESSLRGCEDAMDQHARRASEAQALLSQAMELVKDIHAKPAAREGSQVPNKAARLSVVPPMLP